MKLIVETLYTSLTQQINCNSEKRVHIGAIIPYLYFHNLSSGEFKFEILKSDSVIYSHFFDWKDIKGSIAEDYFHVYYPVVPSNPVQIEEGTYSIVLTALSGYNVEGNSFLGWIKQHEDIQLKMDYLPDSDNQNTLTVRFKEYKDGI